MTENVCNDTHVMRAMWLRQMLIAGVPVEKSDDLRDFLELYCPHEFTGSNHLKTDYLGVVREDELATIRKEVKGKMLRISFDETELNWVCFCVVVGFIDDNGRMQQRCIRLALYIVQPEEFTTNALSSFVIVAIEQILEVRDRNLIKVFTRDGVAINELAVKKLVGGEVKDPDHPTSTIRFVAQYPRATDVKCFSHTIDLCGGNYKKEGITYNRLEGPELRVAYIHLNGLFSGASNKPNKSWLAFMNSAMPGVSGTRWWSREEFYEYVLSFLPHSPIEVPRPHMLSHWVEHCTDDENLEGVHINYLFSTFCSAGPGHNERTMRLIHIQMAVVVDVSKPIREATYLLEGDGPLAFLLPEILRNCELALDIPWSTMDFPNVRGLIDVFATEGHRPPDPSPPLLLKEDTKEAWIQYCQSLAQPCKDYFKEKVMGHPRLDLFRATMFGNPETMQKYPCDANALRAAVQPLVQAKFIDKKLVDGMVDELHAYQMACDVARDWHELSYQERLVNIEDFWAARRKNLDKWTQFAWTCMLLQPSSACVERAFSILKYILTDQQFQSLHDLVETTLMLRYNRKKDH